jgi:hypothetical protein
MTTYVTNVRLWLRGFGRFDEIAFKAGWSGNQLRWRLLYALNYGTRVLTGGACVSWSRWWYERRRKYGHAGFMTRLLNHLEENHGARAGGALWGTTDTRGAVAVGLVFWVLVLVLVVRLAWRVLT